MNPFLLKDTSGIGRQYQGVLKIAGKSYYLWRAVDQHGIVLERRA